MLRAPLGIGVYACILEVPVSIGLQAGRHFQVATCFLSYIS